jgi:hypothetical protein
MSLESTLERTNELLTQIVTILQTGVAAGTEVSAPEVKPTRARKTKDAESVYWLIEKHNTVYEQKAGDTAPSIEGAAQVTKEVYDAKKAQFESLVKTPNTSVATQESAASTQPTAEAAAATAAPAKTDAASNPTAASAGAEQQASTAAPDFPAVVAVLTAINKSTAPGHGREGVLKVIAKFLPGVEKATVPMLSPLGKNAEIIEFAQSILTPAEEEYDPLGV